MLKAELGLTKRSSAPKLPTRGVIHERRSTARQQYRPTDQPESAAPIRKHQLQPLTGGTVQLPGGAMVGRMNQGQSAPDQGRADRAAFPPLAPPISTSRQNSRTQNAALLDTAKSGLWRLQITPYILNTTASSPCLVSFHYASDVENPIFVEAWNAWAEQLLHIIYADLSQQPGEPSQMEQFVIYIRADRKIKLTRIAGSSTNGQRFESIVNRLNDRMELTFPVTPREDTVHISGQ